MIALLLGMFISVLLAGSVVALVAVPARREGRDLLTARGEAVVDSMRESVSSVRGRLER